MLDENSVERHVVVSTGTASGKSLCYNAPVIETLLADPAATALVFPTKALARDQVRALRQILAGVPKSEETVFDVGVYDGDCSEDARATTRDECRVVVTNPDTVHVGVLPNHARGSILARIAVRGRGRGARVFGRVRFARGVDFETIAPVLLGDVRVVAEIHRQFRHGGQSAGTRERFDRISRTRRPGTRSNRGGHERRGAERGKDVRAVESSVEIADEDDEEDESKVSTLRRRRARESGGG